VSVGDPTSRRPVRSAHEQVCRDRPLGIADDDADTSQGTALSMKIDRDLPVSAAAGGIVRETLDGWLTDLVGEETATNARIAATEIVANAVRHGGLHAADVIHLSGVATDDIVRVEFEQASSAAGARVVPFGEREPDDGGFGLRIVQEVSTPWGVREGPPGVVWFEVDRDTP
jgi:anti-sigma regulatory factor (Ser/Thr protein kinase)